MEDYTPQQSDNEKNKKRSIVKKTIYLTIVIIAVILLILSGITLVKRWLSGRETFEHYKNEPAPTVSTTETPTNPINFEGAQLDNENICGWIQIPGIDTIDYPILRSSAKMDDSYYLNHDAYNRESFAGSIYIQKVNHKDFGDPNTVIYGHDMLNGTMFGQLKKFRDKEFFDKNREIYIYTPGHILKYEIISAFVYDNRHIMNSFDFSKPEQRQEFFDMCTNPKSMVKNVVEGAKLEDDDKIITLSTCTGIDSQRYLIVAKLISDTKTE
ncbi:MAG: class B sortase [Clostridia bacterium]|nr:class B sortase [Clostridia bacterium]